jgi:preprotein translocase subunit SecB
MSDNQNIATTPEASTAPLIQIQRVYLKDISLEMPNAPRIFLDSGDTRLEIQVRVDPQTLEAGFYEVGVTCTITAYSRPTEGAQEHLRFLLEAKQSGIFEVRNVPDEDLDQALRVVCPTYVYPYLRVSVADLMTRASLPPVHLADVNFAEILSQEKQNQSEAKIITKH